MRLRTSGRLFEGPNFHEEFVGFLFFLTQCGADERLGNLASVGTVYPFSFCDLFCMAGFVLASRSQPSLSATPSAFPFSFCEVLLREVPLPFASGTWACASYITPAEFNAQTCDHLGLLCHERC